MKKALGIAIAMVLALTLIASVTTCWGSGVILDIGFSPMPDTALSMGLGYRVDDWSFLAQKEDFSTFMGIWNFGFFWEKAGYKVGPVLQFEWKNVDISASGESAVYEQRIVYNDLMFVVGLKQPFAEGGVLSSYLYGQLEFSTASVIGLEIGFELEFNMLDLVEESPW